MPLLQMVEVTRQAISRQGDEVLRRTEERLQSAQGSVEAKSVADAQGLFGALVAEERARRTEPYRIAPTSRMRQRPSCVPVPAEQ